MPKTAYTAGPLRYAEDCLCRYPALKERLVDVEQDYVMRAYSKAHMDITAVSVASGRSNLTAAAAIKLSTSKEYAHLSNAVRAVEETLKRLRQPEREFVERYYWKRMVDEKKETKQLRRRVVYLVCVELGLPER